jgi:hypothetical protein
MNKELQHQIVQTTTLWANITSEYLRETPGRIYMGRFRSFFFLFSLSFLILVYLQS